MTRSARLPAEPTAVAVTIESRIHTLRGTRVMLSGDLARLYGVEPRALAQAVKRNRNRFPRDFMFQLTAAEWRILKSQMRAVPGAVSARRRPRTRGRRAR